MKRTSALVVSLMLAVCAACAEGPAVTTKPALNDPPAAVKTGSRPYEMEGRKEDRVPLISFQDLQGWTVELHDGAEADFVRTREQQLWGDYVGKLTYKGTSSASHVILRPAAPIPIPDAFDSIGFWIYGSNWGWMIDSRTPQVPVNILIRDSTGKEVSYEVTRVRWKEWWLAHKKLPALMEGALLSGIRVGEINTAQENVIFFNSLYFYKENLKPLKFDARPKRNLTPFPGQDQGLNTGPGSLPFPTREETILPTNFEKRFKNSVRRNSATYVFGYTAPDCAVEYRYTPGNGSLGEIEVYVNGRKAMVPMSGGGISFADEKPSDGKLLDAQLADGILRTTWRFGKHEVEYAFRIWQKSLVMDFTCRGGEASELSFGEIHDVTKPKLVLTPFLTISGPGPKVLCCGSPEKPVFASVWADWYRSSGSEMWATDWVQADSARINGGVHYIPKTDGKRNDLYDRIFLTVSPRYEETLPTIANPPSPLGEAAGERLWQESWGPEDYAKEHERSKMLRSYGIDKLTQCNHEIAWRDGGESFTLRTKAAPGKGGDEGLRKYVAEQKSLGWLSGLYTNYADFACVNENWDEDYVGRTPDGEWRMAWPRCYNLKPSRAVELDAKLAPIIQKKFGSNAAYTDVQTAVPPWAYCDYDARVPGAGTFTSTFYAYGELLLHDQKTYGPTWSEGTYHWLYAGLATGNYGLCYTQPDMSTEPLNVAFDLMKIHPLECDIGMPWTGGFFKSGGDWQTPEKIDQSVDHFIAATIAYGHIGWLVEEDHGIQRTCRSYYMLQQLQKRYAMRRPKKIEYAAAVGAASTGDGRAKLPLSRGPANAGTIAGDRPLCWMSISQAIATDAIRDGCLHIVYDNGLDIYVNGSNAAWTLPNAMQLPPWGWYARDKEGFEEYSAWIDGHRVDCVTSPQPRSRGKGLRSMTLDDGYEYLDGRGQFTAHRGLAAAGSIAVRRRDDNVEIIDIHGNEDIGIMATEPMTCQAFDADGKSLGSVDLRETQYGLVFSVTTGARRYVLTPDNGPKNPVQLSVRCPSGYVVAGDHGKASVCILAGKDTAVQSAEIVLGSERVPIPALAGRKLKAGRAFDIGVPVTIPKGLAVGSRFWLGVCASIKGQKKPVESWFIGTVRQPFDISISMIDQDHFVTGVRVNLQGAPDPKITVEPTAGFSLSPSGDQILPPPGAKEAIGMIKVTAGWKGFENSREFPVKAYQEHPLVRDIIGQEGFVWGYARRNEPERRIGDKAFNQRLGAVVSVEEVQCAQVAKQAIFMHPPWVDGTGYTFCETGPIKLPDDQVVSGTQFPKRRDCEFHSFIGLKDGGVVSDGVLFKVLVIEGDKQTTICEQNWKERKWREITGDLAAFKGKTIRIRLVADAGPQDNSISDWASWGEPRIVEKDTITRVAIANGD
jgi:hypothetical protein